MTPDDQQPPGDVGSVAEEATKLLFALTAAGREEGTHERCPHAWCPVCRLVEYMTDNPELLDQAASSAVAAMRSLRELLDQLSPPKESA